MVVDLKKMQEYNDQYKDQKEQAKDVIRSLRGEKNIVRIRQQRNQEIHFDVVDWGLGLIQNIIQPGGFTGLQFALNMFAMPLKVVNLAVQAQQQLQQQLQVQQQQSQNSSSVNKFIIPKQDYEAFDTFAYELEEKYPIIPLKDKKFDDFKREWYSRELSMPFEGFLRVKSVHLYRYILDQILENKILIEQFSEKAMKMLGGKENQEGNYQFSQENLANFICEGLIAHGRAKDQFEQKDQEEKWSYHEEIATMWLNTLKQIEKGFAYELLRMYTEESFLYQDMNKMLREISQKKTEDFAKEFMPLMPFYFMYTNAQYYLSMKYINSLGEQLKKQNTPTQINFFFAVEPKISFLKLYRGAKLPKEKIDELQKCKQKLIKFNEVLSTTKNKQTAVQFAKGGALFAIKVMDSVKQTEQIKWGRQNAANAVYVENITDVPGEEEFSFPSGSEYLVEDVKQPNQKRNYIRIKIIIPLRIDNS